MPTITTLAELRNLYKSPGERAVKKQLTQLDQHGKRFIELASFVIVATVDGQGNMDASPRGGASGFVKVVDDSTIIIPDWPGNNRLDTFSNIIETGNVGLIFFVPGVDETLRINGSATLKTDESLLAQCPERGRLPKLVISVVIKETYLHCAKAIMRAKLWSPDGQIERDALPSMNQMIGDQIGSQDVPESQQEMVKRYEAALY